MRLAVLAAIALVLAAPAAATTVTAKLTTSTRAPVVGQPWRYTVTVRRDGAPITARLRIHVLRGKTLVRCLRGGRLARCRDGELGDLVDFEGRRTGTLRWPQALVASPLTFLVVVKAGPAWIQLRAPLRVRPSG